MFSVNESNLKNQRSFQKNRKNSFRYKNSLKLKNDEYNLILSKLDTKKAKASKEDCVLKSRNVVMDFKLHKNSLKCTIDSNQNSKKVKCKNAKFVKINKVLKVPVVNILLEKVNWRDHINMKLSKEKKDKNQLQGCKKLKLNISNNFGDLKRSPNLYTNFQKYNCLSKQKFSLPSSSKNFDKFNKRSNLRQINLNHSLKRNIVDSLENIKNEFINKTISFQMLPSDSQITKQKYSKYILKRKSQNSPESNESQQQFYTKYEYQEQNGKNRDSPKKKDYTEIMNSFKEDFNKEKSQKFTFQPFSSNLMCKNRKIFNLIFNRVWISNSYLSLK